MIYFANKNGIVVEDSRLAFVKVLEFLSDAFANLAQCIRAKLQEQANHRIYHLASANW